MSESLHRAEHLHTGEQIKSTIEGSALKGTEVHRLATKLLNRTLINKESTAEEVSLALKQRQRILQQVSKTVKRYSPDTYETHVKRLGMVLGEISKDALKRHTAGTLEKDQTLIRRQQNNEIINMSTRLGVNSKEIFSDRERVVQEATGDMQEAYKQLARLSTDEGKDKLRSQGIKEAQIELRLRNARELLNTGILKFINAFDDPENRAAIGKAAQLISFIRATGKGRMLAVPTLSDEKATTLHGFMKKTKVGINDITVMEQKGFLSISDALTPSSMLTQIFPSMPKAMKDGLVAMAKESMGYAKRGQAFEKGMKGSVSHLVELFTSSLAAGVELGKQVVTYGPTLTAVKNTIDKTAKEKNLFTTTLLQAKETVTTVVDAVTDSYLISLNKLIQSDPQIIEDLEQKLSENKGIELLSLALTPNVLDRIAEAWGTLNEEQKAELLGRLGTDLTIGMATGAAGAKMFTTLNKGSRQYRTMQLLRGAMKKVADSPEAARKLTANFNTTISTWVDAKHPELRKGLRKQMGRLNLGAKKKPEADLSPSQADLDVYAIAPERTHYLFKGKMVPPTREVPFTLQFTKGLTKRFKELGKDVKRIGNDLLQNHVPRLPRRLRAKWKQAYIDPMTGSFTRAGLKHAAENFNKPNAPASNVIRFGGEEFALIARGVGDKLLCIAFDGDNFGAFNKLAGDILGDVLIRIMGKHFDELSRTINEMTEPLTQEKLVELARKMNSDIQKEIMGELKSRILKVGDTDKELLEVYKDLVKALKKTDLTDPEVGGSTMAVGSVDLGGKKVGAHTIEQLYKMTDSHLTKMKEGGVFGPAKKNEVHAVPEGTITLEKLKQYTPETELDAGQEAIINNMYEGIGKTFTKKKHELAIFKMMKDAGIDYKKLNVSYREVRNMITSATFEELPASLKKVKKKMLRAREAYLDYLIDNNTTMGSLTAEGFKKAEQGLQKASTPYKRVTVDTEGFKMYNSIIGHAGGDLFIKLKIRAVEQYAKRRGLTASITNVAQRVDTLISAGKNKVPDNLHQDMQKFLETYFKQNFYDQVEKGTTGSQGFKDRLTTWLKDNNRGAEAAKIGTFPVKDI